MTHEEVERIHAEQMAKALWDAPHSEPSPEKIGYWIKHAESFRMKTSLPAAFYVFTAILSGLGIALLFIE